MRDPKGVRNGKENGVWEPDAISHYIFLWSIRNSRLGTSSWGQGTKQQRKRSVTFTISFCSGVKAPTLLPCSSLLYFLTTCSALIMGLMSFVRISYTAESNIGQFFFFFESWGWRDGWEILHSLLLFTVEVRSPLPTCSAPLKISFMKLDDTRKLPLFFSFWVIKLSFMNSISNNVSLLNSF